MLNRPRGGGRSEDGGVFPPGEGVYVKAIGLGQTGPAVEDVQQRLSFLGYKIDASETDAAEFGLSTLAAVRTFRNSEGLPMADEIDDHAWAALVDDTYKLGDRTLYLRLPYFHGADVSHLQMTLNVLGFSCGKVDGLYGPHTEAAVREFQSNAGLYADGMAFQDTFDAIERLHHVWLGKTASPEFSEPHTGLVRAVDVLERCAILASGTDPIARNVVSRMWNVAFATTSGARFTLVDDFSRVSEEGLAGCSLALAVSTQPLSADDACLPAGMTNVVVSDVDALNGGIRDALSAAAEGPVRLRVELPALNSYDGTVTDRKVQSAAIALLDALCTALDR